MIIDLDASKQKQPTPWNFTVKVNGQVYTVREPDLADLKAFQRCSECSPTDAAMEFLRLFCRLTGIDQDQAHLNGQQLLAFFRGLIEYRRQREQLSNAGSILN